MTARRQQDRAAEEQPTGQSGLNQGLAAVVTALGVLVLAGAWLLREGPDQYWLSLLVNLGTTLLLFAVLVLVERRLYQRIEAVLSGPRTLPEAQQALRESLAARRDLLQSQGDREQAIEESALRVGDKLKGSGLVQLPASNGRSVLLFGDRDTADESSLTWRVSWEREQERFRLCHLVTTSSGPRRTWVRRLARGGGALTTSDVQVLQDFENQVLPILKELIVDLDDPARA